MKSYAIILESYLIPTIESDIDYSQRPKLFATKFRQILSRFNVLANTIRHSNNKIPKSVDICTFINDTTKGKKFLEDIVANNTIEELKSDPEFMETVAGILDTENNAKIINNLKEIALISTVKLTDGMKSKPQSIKNADGALAWFQFVANQIIAIYNVFF